MMSRVAEAIAKLPKKRLNFVQKLLEAEEKILLITTGELRKLEK